MGNIRNVLNTKSWLYVILRLKKDVLALFKKHVLNVYSFAHNLYFSSLLHNFLCTAIAYFIYLTTTLFPQLLWSYKSRTAHIPSHFLCYQLSQSLEPLPLPYTLHSYHHFSHWILLSLLLMPFLVLSHIVSSLIYLCHCVSSLYLTFISIVHLPMVLWYCCSPPLPFTYCYLSLLSWGILFYFSLNWASALFTLTLYINHFSTFFIFISFIFILLSHSHKPLCPTILDFFSYSFFALRYALTAHLQLSFPLFCWGKRWVSSVTKDLLLSLYHTSHKVITLNITSLLCQGILFCNLLGDHINNGAMNKSIQYSLYNDCIRKGIKPQKPHQSRCWNQIVLWLIRSY